MFRIGRLLSLATATALAGCASTPLTSVPRLAAIDFATTDVADLRAGVVLPPSLRPLDGTVRLTIVAEPGDGSAIRRSFVLQRAASGEGSDVAVAAVAGSAGAVHVYRLSEADAGEVDELRGEILARKQGGRGRMEISIGAKACREAELPEGPILMTTYLKTTETERFVPLNRPLDLRTLKAPAGAVTALPGCREASQT